MNGFYDQFSNFGSVFESAFDRFQRTQQRATQKKQVDLKWVHDVYKQASETGWLAKMEEVGGGFRLTFRHKTKRLWGGDFLTIHGDVEMSQVNALANAAMALFSQYGQQ